MSNYRLTRFGDDVDDDRDGIADSDQPDVDDELQEEPEPVDDDVKDDDNENCVECGAVDAVQNPKEEISNDLPAAALCQVCLIEQI